MLKICLAFWKSEPRYAYENYADKKTYSYVFENDNQTFSFYFVLLEVIADP